MTGEAAPASKLWAFLASTGTQQRGLFPKTSKFGAFAVSKIDCSTGSVVITWTEVPVGLSLLCSINLVDRHGLNAFFLWQDTVICIRVVAVQTAEWGRRSRDGGGLHHEIPLVRIQETIEIWSPHSFYLSSLHSGKKRMIIHQVEWISGWQDDTGLCLPCISVF